MHRRPRIMAFLDAGNIKTFFPTEFDTVHPVWLLLGPRKLVGRRLSRGFAYTGRNRSDITRRSRRRVQACCDGDGTAARSLTSTHNAPAVAAYQIANVVSTAHRGATPARRNTNGKKFHVVRWL